MMELIAQIPEEHNHLAQALRAKLDVFDFGLIADLAQQVKS